MNNEEIIKFIKKNNIKKESKYLLKTNFKLLKKIYTSFNLKNRDYEDTFEDMIFFINNIYFVSNNSLNKEIKSWIMNIKHTYELLNRLLFKKFYLNIYFEFKFYTSNHRIDILIQNKKNFLLIESSYPYSKALENSKKEQVEKYLNEFKKSFKIKNIYTSTYFDDDYNSKISTLKYIKKL